MLLVWPRRELRGALIQQVVRACDGGDQFFTFFYKGEGKGVGGLEYPDQEPSWSEQKTAHGTRSEPCPRSRRGAM